MRCLLAWLLLLAAACPRGRGEVERNDTGGCGDPAAGCTRRCCAEGHRFDAALRCAPAPEDPPPPRPGLGQLRGYPCALRFRLRPDRDPEDAFQLLDDGRLLAPGVAPEPFPTSQFCVEPLGDGLAAFLCFPDQRRAVSVAYPACMLASLPCLAATFLAYAVVPRLRNLHGKVLMCHVASLFLLYLVLAAADLGAFRPGTVACVVAAFIIYFSFLASFFWLNVMCFDIWWTFSGFRPLRGSEKEREHKKFVMYSVYAWGSSSLLLLVCLLTDRHPYVRERVLSPQFGKDRCWFTTQSAEAAYFYGPMGLIVLCNIVLFVLTALRIVKLKKETAMLKGEESRRHDVEENKQRFVLYLKLFVVMGVNWGMEVISFAAGGPQYIWYITDIGNTLQGVLIFLIFVWKEKIRRLLAKRLCPRLARGSGRPGSQTRGTLSKSVATPSSSYSITTKTTCNGETSRMAREESDVV
ncbi:G-protein coupled receptor Mth2-like isoform X4 [Bacillus rossius redtenbacheri]|uniref:G-protein coupled receptor Mth2-like isoform X4 n=1 Tax=Bacillus rossius redtenbacheri TaxID=93214 RepID=UPI002FDE5BE8